MVQEGGRSPGCTLKQPKPDINRILTGVTGTSREMEQVRELVAKYSRESDPVLLSGETGVGKNHIAGLIHNCSGRQGKYVVVDTPNIDPNLFESKLFGHRKGAFTDARYDKTGLVEEASKGTLFFDEITEVPQTVQSKLLRFIDTRKYYVLGESTERSVDARIIAATNKDLWLAVAENEFRRDLYYRLSVLEIEIPPLNLRKVDIKKLVHEHRHLLRGKKIGAGFWDVVNNFQWPGNVRELLTVLKRAGILLESPLSGEKMATIINGNGKKHMTNNIGNANGYANGYANGCGSEYRNGREVGFHEGNDYFEIRDTVAALERGESFWNLIWKPFIDRELDRKTVKGMLRYFYAESFYNFRRMVKRLNMRTEEYTKFMSLVYKYRIDPRR